MKRKLLAIALAAAFAFSLIQVTVFADEIRVTIEGQQVTFQAQQPVIVDGRTLVPVRGVFEHLGFEVDWDGAIQQATLASDEFTVILTIGSASFTTNGISHTLDVPAQIIGGSTMLPIRAVLESVGYYLDWDNATRTVLIWAESEEELDTELEEELEAEVEEEQETPTVAAGPDYVMISPIRRFSTRLTRLELSDRELTCRDIQNLRYMTNLTYLNLSRNQISDLTPLSGLTNLTHLILYNNQIHDIAPLSGLTNLEHLDLSNYLINNRNQIVDVDRMTISSPAEREEFRTLRTGDNRIHDLTPLSGLTNLEHLALRDEPFSIGNQMRNRMLSVSGSEDLITPLSGLTNLTRLDLRGWWISDITPLSGLVNLTRLNLSFNEISDLTPLSGLVNLTWLDLSRNRITNISPLASLKNLSNLILSPQMPDYIIHNWSPVSHVENVQGRP